MSADTTWPAGASPGGPCRVRLDRSVRGPPPEDRGNAGGALSSYLLKRWVSVRPVITLFTAGWMMVRNLLNSADGWFAT